MSWLASPFHSLAAAHLVLVRRLRAPLQSTRATHMDDLLKLAGIFMTSNTILINALGVARTEPLKTGVSLIGFIMTALWLACAFAGPPIPTDLHIRWAIFNGLPFLFLLGWLISGIVHAERWYHNKPAT